jgi:hypothetical protein
VPIPLPKAASSLSGTKKITIVFCPNGQLRSKLILSYTKSNTYSFVYFFRLTPPLCLNFLSMIHMDSHVIKYDMEETAYTNIMGHMDVISIVADYFNVYFPIALLALSSATYFSLGAR